jgi:hypothetical protein
MKSENPSPRRTAAGRGKSDVGIPHLPMEWMDPMSWRLPSGKALAEFALQTGFLAPLIMRAPKGKKKPDASEMAMNPGVMDLPVTRDQVKEAPARTASFR